MRPDDHVLDVKSNLRGEKIQMDIDPTALRHIMKSLTGLYSDQELAVIREYSTNAYDSHVEAGQTRPIEVTLPSPLAPSFSVKDYGIGMDVEDIRNIYSRYGTSTKRESDKVVGMLGFGCKSALAYTDQFTVIGIKNGQMIQVSVARDEDGGSSMTVNGPFGTDEPNGVEIIVPAKQGNGFQKKSDDFFRFWDSGTVLVNGTAPDRIDGIWIAPDICLTSDVQRPMIVMGNVSYPDPTYNGYGGYNTLHPVCFVDIGSVAFVPSREALEVIPKTTVTINGLKQRIKDETNKALLKIVAAAANPWDAIQEIRKNKAAGLVPEDAVWRGQKIPVTFTADIIDVIDPTTKKVTKEHVPFYLWRMGGYSKYSWDTRSTISLIQFGKVIWIEGYEGDKFTPYKSQKLEQWWGKKSATGATFPDRVVFCKNVPKEITPWIDPNSIYDWADIDAEKLPKNASTTLRSGRPSGSYYSWTVNGRADILAADIDVTQPLFWMEGNKWTTTPQTKWLLEKFPGGTLIFLPANRVNKFKRDFPEAVFIPTQIEKMQKEWNDNLTADQKNAIKAKEDYNYRYLRLLDDVLILDPQLAYAVQMAKADTAKFQGEYDFYRRHLGMGVTTSWVYDGIANYPLLTCVGSDEKSKSHAILYVNAVYTASQDKKKNDAMFTVIANTNTQEVSNV